MGRLEKCSRVACALSFTRYLASPIVAALATARSSVSVATHSGCNRLVCDDPFKHGGACVDDAGLDNADARAPSERAGANVNAAHQADHLVYGRAGDARRGDAGVHALWAYVGVRARVARPGGAKGRSP